MDALLKFFTESGFARFFEGDNWKQLVMIAIACVLLYLAIVKKFEPLLLLPIAFGMLLTNLPAANMFHGELFAGGHVHWEFLTGGWNTLVEQAVGSETILVPALDPAIADGQPIFSAGLLDWLYLGVKLGIYPCLIFFGVGAMTDFGPLISNPKSMLMGAAAQLGIFLTFIAASNIGSLGIGGLTFTAKEAASIGIIGGADGPTAIFVTTKLAPQLLGPIAVAAYSYMALVPVI